MKLLVVKFCSVIAIFSSSFCSFESFALKPQTDHDFNILTVNTALKHIF